MGVLLISRYAVDVFYISSRLGWEKEEGNFERCNSKNTYENKEKRWEGELNGTKENYEKHERRKWERCDAKNQIESEYIN